MKDVEDKMPVDRFNRKATLVEVIDGDTIDVIVDLGWSMKFKERLRLSGVDTPEIRNKIENKAGSFVKGKVEEFLAEDEELMITSKAYDRTGKVRGKYGRTLAEVFRLRDGECLNSYLLDEKLGWPLNDKGELVGERSLALLSGLPGELRA